MAPKAKKKRSASRCTDCGGTVNIYRPTAYRYAAGGLPDVVLEGGVELERCDSCGAEALSIHRIGQLHEVLALLSQKHSRPVA